MISQSFSADKRYAIIRVVGENSLEEFKQGATNFMEAPEFTRTVHRLCDFSEASFVGLSNLDFIRYVGFLRKLPTSRSAKTALVGVKARSFLMMFINQMSSLNIKSFDAFEEAEQWVAEGQGTSLGKEGGSDETEAVKYHRFEGVLTIGAALSMQQTWVEDPGYDPKIPVLWDMQQAKFSTSLPELQEGARKMIEERSTGGPIGKTAVLILTKQQEILVRSSFALGISSGLLEVFSDTRKAHAWLAI